MNAPQRSQPSSLSGKTWSHSRREDRDEGKAYRLPRNEVLPWLMQQTEFLTATSSEANDQYRRIIYEEQYPSLHGPIEPLAPCPDWSRQEAAGEIARHVERYAVQHLEARPVKVGYTPVLREHVYSDGEVTLPHAIVLGLPMRFAETAAAPEPKSGEEVTRNYMELGGLTISLGQFLREAGYSAEVHHPRGDASMNCEAIFIPHAIAAGFGELGRHGSLISREFGPRVRLSMITTDAPIPSASPADTGVLEFCTWCTKCLKACPVDAIPERRETRRGSYRFIVDTSACLPYFAETDGCGICIAVCPFNRPDEARAVEFVDQVRSLHWLKRAATLRERQGVEAMERYITAKREGRHDR